MHFLCFLSTFAVRILQTGNRTLEIDQRHLSNLIRSIGKESKRKRVVKKVSLLHQHLQQKTQMKDSAVMEVAAVRLRTRS